MGYGPYGVSMFSHQPPDFDNDKKQPVISRGFFLRE